MIWKVARFVDNRVHMQQAAATTKVGYNTFYDYKLYQINRNQDYSGTKATQGILDSRHYGCRKGYPEDKGS